ncbi:MAG: NADPH:quinone reductase Zn-dependent oxidoreductase [Patescibacteria group bacterium]|nr:NADPH:quinone reductase Zn-dependent oxidoreductase [Patescibacteria group bacterium]
MCMKAAQISQYGDPTVISICEAQKPELLEGQILISVRAASLNPFDSVVRSGRMADVLPVVFPATQGGDLAGTVAEVGVGVSGFKVGDEVYGQASLFRGGSGSMAEFAQTIPDQIALKPKNIDFNQAAALPLTGVSALQALTGHMKLQAGQKILIHGGAGGIGTFAIQLAKDIGAYVITTVAADEFEYARNLGADEVIDYSSQKFEEVASGLDAVYDTVAGETYTRSFEVLKKGGIIVSMLEQPNQELMSRYGVQAIAQQTVITTKKLEELAKLVEARVITVNVDKVFPLEETAKAFEYRETARPRGKVVVAIS